MAGCLGEEAEKTGKGTGRERIWHIRKDIRSFELKKGEMAALRTAVGQLQAEGGGGPLAPKTATPAPSRRLSVLLHDLLTTNADGVDIGARATARVDLDPQF